MTVDSLATRLRTRGWRITPQRQAIVSVLDGASGHFSADAVYAVARASEASVSLATVYNTLTALAAMGELREVRDGRGPTRFDPNVAPHHHLVCDACGRLVDIEPVDLQAAVAPSAARQDFTVESVDVIVHGSCRECASGAAAGLPRL